MKKRLLIVFAAAILGKMAYGQGLYMASYVEQTNSSPKVGVQMGYDFDHGYAIGYKLGAFYQNEVDLLPGRTEKSHRFREQEFFGLVFGAELLTWRNFEVDLGVRTGIVNKTNFSITPSIDIDYQPGKRIKFAAGIGVRSFRPTFLTGLNINLHQ